MKKQKKVRAQEILSDIDEEIAESFRLITVLRAKGEPTK
jgi:hypothetical protein